MYPTIGSGCDVAPSRAGTIMVASPPPIVGEEVLSSFTTGFQLLPVVVIFPRSRASVPWPAGVLPVQGSGCLVQSKSHRCRSIPDTGSWTCPRVILLRSRSGLCLASIRWRGAVLSLRLLVGPKNARPQVIEDCLRDRFGHQVADVLLGWAVDREYDPCLYHRSDPEPLQLDVLRS